MSKLPPWGDARPLSGCDVIRPPSAPRPSHAAAKKPVSAVVKKVLAANRFLDKHARTLTSAAVVVWVMLWRDERDGVARTAITDLARRAGVSEATIKRALRALRAGGHLRELRRGYPTRGPTVYRVVACPKRLALGAVDGCHR
jgi:DNA-binding transcriptional ArsR family regulator